MAGDALQKAIRQAPDLVLSDVMMPEMDGFQLLAALRQEKTTSLIPVILLSARAGEDAQIEGMESGADDYLVKPFTARELLARLRRTSKSRVSAASAEREANPQRELQDARQNAALAGDHISDIFITFDSKWRYTFIDTAGLKLLGLEPENCQGRPFGQSRPPGTELEAQSRRCMDLRVPVELEHQSAITRRVLRVRVFPAPDGGVVVSASDITERRRTEQELRVKQEIHVAYAKGGADRQLGAGRGGRTAFDFS